MSPLRIWTITAFCLALLLAAMGGVTWWMLRMEDRQEQMAAEAVLGERERLALWRMESVASNLVLGEITRAPEHYKTISLLPDLSSLGKSSAEKQRFMTASPLLADRPAYVKLHFQLDPSGKLSSPQVPEGTEAKFVMNDVPAARLSADQASLTELRQVMASPSTLQLVYPQPGTSILQCAMISNRDVLLTGNGIQVLEPAAQQAVTTTISNWNTPVNSAVSAQFSADPGSANISGSSNTQADFDPPQIAQTFASVPDAQQQAAMNTGEANYRQQAFDNIYNVQAGKRRAAQAKEPPGAGNQALQQRAHPSKEPSAQPDPKQEAARVDPVASGKEPSAFPVTPAKPQEITVKQTDQPPPPGALKSARDVFPWQDTTAGSGTPDGIGDVRPLWVSGKLVVTRSFTEAGKSVVQGAWFDWPKLRTDLLASVLTDFPEARLEPESSPSADHRRLVSLPVRFFPGAVALIAGPFWSPMKISLAVAWACVLLAVAAVALVLRGMMTLSERRASFVSSVTHELRTPLSTFKLYSEMLADGMVTEPARRQSYLETLTSEADRLGHLVENVLTYSRLERGKAPSRSDALTLRQITDRLSPRLQQRAALAGMDFSCQLSPEAERVTLHTDLPGLEQILFNLVDNAAKYGRLPDQPGRVELSGSIERGRAVLRVRDHGPGIDPREARRLFRPFHKSAREAAHSAPGVGLGLALCRRLAADLGGKLEIDAAWKQGACFALTLPAEKGTRS